MKVYYIEEIAEVIVQHLVKAKSKKEAIELAKQWEIEKSEIIEYVWCWPMEIIEVWVYSNSVYIK